MIFLKYKILTVPKNLFSFVSKVRGKRTQVQKHLLCHIFVPEFPQLHNRLVY